MRRARAQRLRAHPQHNVIARSTPSSMRWILAALLCAGTRATGKGPVGIYVIDDRYAAVADSNANALLIVDVLRGGVVGSRRWPSPKNDTKEWYSLTGVASCANCSFAYLTSNHGPAFWRMDLTKPLAAMARADDFADLARATLVELPCLRSLDADTRMVALKRDASVGFVALKAAGVAAFAPRAIHASAQRCDALDVRLVASKDALRGGKTFAGLALSRDDGTLYVTAENGVFSIRATGTFQKRAEKLTGEPACGLHNAHLRETAPQNGHLYVVGHPSADNAGMAVYRLGTKKGACALVAGDVNKHEDWRDGAGAAARFSRPHQMAAFRANELLLTDIDNRAVRRITLADGRASTVPYDNNHLYTELWRLGGPQRHDHGQYAPGAGQRVGDRGGGGRRLRGPRRRALPARRAARRRRAGALRRSAAWTSQSCHSCWLHWPGECPRPKAHEQAKKRTSAAWGAGYQMVARVGAGDVRFECRLAERLRDEVGLCCSSPNGFIVAMLNGPAAFHARPSQRRCQTSCRRPRAVMLALPRAD